MAAILLQTLPFFAVIGLGWGAGRLGAFPAEATAWLTKFVFYFALSAMLFGFASSLSFAELWQGRLAASYLVGSFAVWTLAFAVAKARGQALGDAAMEAQASVIGNVGFLGIPMLAVLLGPASVPTVILILALDLIVFGSLVVLLVTAGQGGAVGAALLRKLGSGLLANPMIVSMALGLLWGASGLPIPDPAADTLTLLGAAATPGALFAIGASLAAKRAERILVPVWLSFAKLVLHPLAVLLAATVIGARGFPVGVMVACAALPVAGNVFILAQHYGVAPARMSASILISTAVSVLTVTGVVALVLGAAS